MKTKRKEYWTRPVGAPAGASLVTTDAGHGLAWGVLRRTLAGRDDPADLREFVWQKLTHGRGPSWMGDWHPTATHNVMLPDDSPSDLLDARRLAERYEAEAFSGIKDLACVAKLTIGRHDRLLFEWQRIQEFAREEFCRRRSMSVIAILHVPARSGVRRDTHAHLVAPARELGRDGFGAFLRPFATDQGGVELARAWATWPG